MPDLSPTIDARMLFLGSGGTTWANSVGDGVTAGSISTAGASWSSGINAIDLTPLATQVERYFVEFDTSGVTSTPTSATFKLYGHTNTGADVICAQASFASAGALVVGDWDTWNESSPVAYTDEVTSWSTSGYNEFTLTSTALSAMASLDEFQMVCLEADNDYDQTSAGSGAVNISSGYYTRNAADAANRPLLSYNEPIPSDQSIYKILSGNLTIKSGQLTIK